jgi:hypothetical protein
MITACLIATAMNLNQDDLILGIEPDTIIEDYDAVDGPSEEEAYLQGSLPSNQMPPHHELITILRGIQDHSSACRCPLTWKDCEEIDGRCR